MGLIAMVMTKEIAKAVGKGIVAGLELAAKTIIL